MIRKKESLPIALDKNAQFAVRVAEWILSWSRGVFAQKNFGASCARVCVDVRLFTAKFLCRFSQLHIYSVLLASCNQSHSVAHSLISLPLVWLLRAGQSVLLYAVHTAHHKSWYLLL